MSWITLWLSFLSGVNRRASSHHLTKMVYIPNKHIYLALHVNGAVSVGCLKGNTKVNVTASRLNITK